MDTITAQPSLDRTGKTITTFVVFDAAAALQTMQVGDRLEVVTEDLEFFQHDIAAWCKAAGHVLVASDAAAGRRRGCAVAGRVRCRHVRHAGQCRGTRRHADR